MPKLLYGYLKGNQEYAVRSEFTFRDVLWSIQCISQSYVHVKYAMYLRKPVVINIYPN